MHSVPVLRPGLDFQGGVIYVTLPALMRTTKKVGKGKDAYEIPTTQVATMCVTSERQRFLFDEEHVHDLGFRFPQTFVQQDHDSRWPLPMVQAFLDSRTEAPDPFTLYQSIRKVYETYIEFSDDRMYDLLALYVMGSYVFRAFTSMAYLHFTGSKQSGKSTNIKLLQALAFNTVYSANSTPASLFRQIAGCPGTICIDEAEKFESEDAQVLRAILNAGYTDGSNVQRAEAQSDSTWINREYPAFSPKALASINALDSVMADRCIVISMFPALRAIPEFNDKDTRWPILRTRLYLWAMEYLPAVAATVNEWGTTKRHTAAPTLMNRSYQLAQMYLVLADVIGDEALVTRLVGYFNEYYAAQTESANATDRIRLVLRVLPTLIKTIAPRDGGFYQVKEIQTILGEYLDEDQKDPRRFTTRSTGKHLETLGFTHKRASKAGLQYQITEDGVKAAMRKRRVEPLEQDKTWFESSESLTFSPDAPPDLPQSSIDWISNYDEANE